MEEHHYSWIDAETEQGTHYYRLRQVDLNGNISYSHEVIVNSVLGVRDETAPREFSLKQNYPNPFNPTTYIRYQLPVGQDGILSYYVTLKVYNVLGMEVVTLVSEKQTSGYKLVEWDATNVPSGIYFYKLIAGSFIETKKLLLLK